MQIFSKFHSLLSSCFDVLMAPFASSHPLWPLLAFSAPTGIVMLVIFRYSSDQEGIRKTKNLIKAHILEIRIFKDDLGILLSAQKRILIYNLRYMGYALKPMMLMIVPMAIILIQLDGWLGYRPLRPEESAIVTVSLSTARSEVLSDVSIQSDKGLVIETPSLRIPSERAVAWRVRAKEVGEHHLTVKVSDNTVQKSVLISDGILARISLRRVADSWDNLLNPGEDAISGNGLIRSIEVSYPSRSFEIFGLKTHWLILFFVLSMAFGFVSKAFFQVEI